MFGVKLDAIVAHCCLGVLRPVLCEDSVQWEYFVSYNITAVPKC